MLTGNKDKGALVPAQPLIYYMTFLPNQLASLGLNFLILILLLKPFQLHAKIQHVLKTDLHSYCPPSSPNHIERASSNM